MSKKDTEENKLISKIDNKWEFRAYLFKYRMKEIMLLIIVLLLAVIVLQQTGFEFSSLFDAIGSIFGGKK